MKLPLKNDRFKTYFALDEFEDYLRSDCERNIFIKKGRPNHALDDRAHGATYINSLCETAHMN